MFKIMDDQREILAYLYLIDQDPQCDVMLRWLIANNLTGKNFIGWVKSSGTKLGTSPKILIEWMKDYLKRLQ